jgi:hypothetical protein
MRGKHVLLGEQFDDVSEGLKQSVGSDAAGSDTQLDVREDFPLDPLNVSKSG